MVVSIPDNEYLTREREFSYAIACFPSFLNPKTKRNPLSKNGLDISFIAQELRKRDEIGRVQMLGVFQDPKTKTKKERQYENYMNDFIDRFLYSQGIIEEVPRDLILVGYLPEPTRNDEQELAELTPEQRKNVEAIGSIGRSLLKKIDPTFSFGRDMPPEPITKEQFKGLTNFYVRSSDSLERLAICPIEELPDFSTKDIGAIPLYHRRIYRPDPLSRKELQQLLLEAPGLLQEGLELKNKYGLTRQEMFQFKGIYHKLQEITGPL